MKCDHEYYLREAHKVRKSLNIWKCWKCDYKTRHYDGIDGQMGRPIHEWMSVALRGFNTIG